MTRKIRLPAPFARLIGDRRAVSAVEFALVAPLMITLYFGCVELSDGIAADRKVTLIAATLANLAASCGDSNANAGSCTNNVISTTEMNNIFAAATAIMTPYSATPLKMTLSCISIDSSGTVTVPWSATPAGVNAGTTLTSFTFPTAPTDETALKINGSQLLYAEVSYLYTPVVGNGVVPQITFKDHMFMSPRIGAPSYNDGTSTKTCP